jgi:hypothetical protein
VEAHKESSASLHVAVTGSAGSTPVVCFRAEVVMILAKIIQSSANITALLSVSCPAPLHVSGLMQRLILPMEKLKQDSEHVSKEDHSKIFVVLDYVQPAFLGSMPVSAGAEDPCIRDRDLKTSFNSLCLKVCIQNAR